MTGPLLKITTTPFKAVRLSQGGRLVSSDSVDIERRKAIARMRAFSSQHSIGGRSTEVSYVNQINRTFAAKPSHHVTVPTSGGAARSVSTDASNVPAASAGSNAAISSAQAATGTNTAAVADVQTNVSAQSDSAYTMDRGAFEFRVVKGELSFIPPLTMTVITQRPEVHFEYTGGFHYVSPGGINTDSMNLSI